MTNEEIETMNLTDSEVALVKKEKKVKKDKKVKKEKKEKKSKKEKKEKKEKKSSKRVRDDDDSVDAAAVPEEKKVKVEKPSGDLSNFNIHPKTVECLAKRGITSLFEIQEMTFNHIFQGKDMMGRARTGMGKTLAFALPVIERLLNDGPRNQRGRAPKVICLAPTRELAKQVASEFELTGPSFETTCIYGGTPYSVQTNAMRRGIDILVGTTGRVIDHIDQGTLRLDECEYLILDEADTMLEMGFREDVQRIFDAMNAKEQRRQTILFSATIPSWVKDVANKYMKSDRIVVNLVKDSDNQASKDVQHIAIPCHWQAKATVLGDLLAVYAPGNARSIVFAETKKDCNELSVHPSIRQDCQVLHGDIAQGQRETTMAAFRSGKIKLLIATDVAARGLDMIVDLVVNIEPPRTRGGHPDVDTYVHRSGRTGRAGRKGVCITLHTQQQKHLIQQIETRIKNKFIKKQAPQPEEKVLAAAGDAMNQLNEVDPEMVQVFLPKAKEIIESLGTEKSLAAALACMTGYAQPMRKTSLMTGLLDYTTVLFKAQVDMFSTRYAWNALNQDLPEEIALLVKGMKIALDPTVAVFDVSKDGLKVIKEIIEAKGQSCCYSIPKELPAMKELTMRSTGGSGRGGGRGRGGRSRGGRGGPRRY